MANENDISWEDYKRFEENLKHKNGFFVDGNSINSIRDAVKGYSSQLKSGVKLYRARIHKSEDNKTIPFLSEKMSTPDPDKTLRGRGNPDGIPYLYLSSSLDLCTKEVTPKYKDIITIAEFVLKQDIRIRDSTGSLSASKDEYINYWAHWININFSKPQLTDRPELEYLPYQFICELIKNENYVGVKYNSTYDRHPLTEEYNLVLFDKAIATTEDSKCRLIEITAAKYEYMDISGKS